MKVGWLIAFIACIAWSGGSASSEELIAPLRLLGEYNGYYFVGNLIGAARNEGAFSDWSQYRELVRRRNDPRFDRYSTFLVYTTQEIENKLAERDKEIKSCKVDTEALGRELGYVRQGV